MTPDAQRVAARYAARVAPPSIVAAANMLKRQGLTPVDVWFGEAKPSRKQVIGLGDMVQNRRGDLLFFAGVASDGTAILGKTEQEAERLHKKVIEDRKQWPPRQAALGEAPHLKADVSLRRAVVRSRLAGAMDRIPLETLIEDWFTNLIELTKKALGSKYNPIDYDSEHTDVTETGDTAGIVGVVGVPATKEFKLQGATLPEEGIRIFNLGHSFHFNIYYHWEKNFLIKVSVRQYSDLDSNVGKRNFSPDSQPFEIAQYVLGWMLKESDRLRTMSEEELLTESQDQRWSRSAFPEPLKLQPDYHPCQHGGPCQCGGQCGCGK